MHSYEVEVCGNSWSKKWIEKAEPNERKPFKIIPRYTVKPSALIIIG